MKVLLSCLPLLGLAPLGHFLGSYLEGAGILPDGIGFIVSAGSMFILPWLISAFFASAIPKIKFTIRVLVFLGALVVQVMLLFSFAPPGATAEMMGIARRLRREFPPQQLHDCAELLRQKHHDGTLKLGEARKLHDFSVPETAVVVADSELPVSLRGRFQRVFIQSNPATSEEQVFFALDPCTGIVCDNRPSVREFFVCSMAEGVHAYRYQRL